MPKNRVPFATRTLHDATMTNAGMIGPWTKADSVTLFDDLAYGEVK